MNLDPCIILPIALAWTIAGSLLIGLASWFQQKLSKNAATRHLSWCAIFGGLIIAPFIHLTSSEAVACSPHHFSVAELALIWGWTGGVVLMLSRYALGLIRLRQMWSESVVFNPGLIQESSSLLEKVEVRISTNVSIPLTWGFWKPVILLPGGATEWPASRLNAVLLHELAHVRRGDHLTQSLSFIVCALHWFNPFFWMAASRMEAEAEIAADDYVILSGIRPSSYASELLQLASQLVTPGRRLSAVETAMVKPFTVENRIVSIVDPTSRRGRVRFKEVILLNGMILLLLISAGFSIRSLQPAPASPACLSQPAR